MGPTRPRVGVLHRVEAVERRGDQGQDRGAGGDDRRHGAGRDGARRARGAHLAEERDVADPPERAHDHPDTAGWNREEGPHDGGVELGSRVAGHLGECVIDREGRLVAPRRGHDVEGVGHGHDPPGSRDLATREPRGVALTVPALVMLRGGIGPLAQPWTNGSDDRLRRGRMLAQLLPLQGGRPSLLGQDLRVDRQLPDVVRQRPPVEEIPFPLGQIHVLGDERGEGPDPFAVSPGQPIVIAKDGEQRQQRPHGLPLARIHLSLVEPSLELSCSSGTQGEAHARGHVLVGERERQPQQRDQGQETLEGTVADDDGGHRDDNHRAQPEHERGDRVASAQV